MVLEAARAKLEKNPLFQNKHAEENVAVSPASNQCNFP